MVYAGAINKCRIRLYIDDIAAALFLILRFVWHRHTPPLELFAMARVRYENDIRDLRSEYRHTGAGHTPAAAL